MQSKVLQYYLLALASLLFSVKLESKCSVCSIVLIGAFVVFFIWASVLLYRKKKKIKRLKDKGLL